jgi:hypothetical protein
MLGGCIADDADKASGAGDDEAIIADDGFEADIGEHQIDPDSANATTDYVVGYVRLWYTGGRNGTIPCEYTHRSTRFAPGSGNWPTEAGNGCSTRVWLYQYADYTGATLCLNPHTNTGTLHSTWRRYRVTSNPARCN